MRALREIDVRRFLKPLGIGFSIFAVCLVLVALLHAALFGPAGKSGERTQFIVAPESTLEEVGNELEAQGVVRHGFIFQIAYVLTRKEDTVRPGGYVVSESMDAWELARTLANAPYLAWVTIPQGMRREQVGELLRSQLSWTDDGLQTWLSVTSATSTLSEGIYFADTYLIPSDQSPEQIAARLISRFNDEVESYKISAREQNINWDDALVLASLIEREAAKNDKELVSGILWNRLHKGMMLQVDATLQYAIGTTSNGWWPAPTSDDKYIESAYNTYQNVGLPPQPIATPSLASIYAALHPTQTNCLYYLHDTKGRIHCATNYQAHLANVRRYLR